MNQRIIWLIVGLMSIAIVGVVVSQVGVVMSSVSAIEEKFEENVYDALNDIVRKLETEENRKAFETSANGFMTYYREQGMRADDRGTSAYSLSYSLHRPGAPGSGVINDETLLDRLMSEVSGGWCECAACVKARDQLYRRNYSTLNAWFQQDQQPLEERLDPSLLESMLYSSLKDKGIEANFNFGVFSNEKNSLVIVNDHYVVGDNLQKNMLVGSRASEQSRLFEISLFPRSFPPPGMLMIHFPDQRRYLWRSLRLNLLGTLLFAGIILFCFVYTINVIFRQKKISEMKTDFINNMTHEFKTPIATISLAADSINSPMVIADPGKIQRFANIIKQENSRMNNQVEKVLQLARIDRENVSLKIVEVNLHEVIAAALENISLQVEKRNGSVEAHLQAKQAMIQGDLTHISSVINNLLDNANKYTPNDPKIVITTKDAGNGVEVTVSDNGIGMSKESRKYIFDKFYRVHTGNLHDVKGFGLGLSYVKAIMTAHKGTIEVKSELGKGSSFTLFFPHRHH